MAAQLSPNTSKKAAADSSSASHTVACCFSPAWGIMPSVHPSSRSSHPPWGGKNCAKSSPPFTLVRLTSSRRSRQLPRWGGRKVQFSATVVPSWVNHQEVKCWCLPYPIALSLFLSVFPCATWGILGWVVLRGQLSDFRKSRLRPLPDRQSFSKWLIAGYSVIIISQHHPWVGERDCKCAIKMQLCCKECYLGISH